MIKVTVYIDAAAYDDPEQAADDIAHVLTNAKRWPDTVTAEVLTLPAEQAAARISASSRYLLLRGVLGALRRAPGAAEGDAP